MLGGARTPLSLADHAGLALLRLLYEKAHTLEKTYLDYISKLSIKSAELEENLSLNNVDCSEVISNYSAKLEEQRVAKERDAQQRKRKAEEEALVQNRRVTRGLKRKSQEQAASVSSGKKNSTVPAATSSVAVAPTHHQQSANKAAQKTVEDFEYLLSASAPERYIDAIRNRHKEFQQAEGIPADIDPEEYIRYRKCLFVENISEIRRKLLQVLTPDAVEYLLRIILRMESKQNESLDRRQQPGIFTLKVLLFNKFSRIFVLNSNEFPRTKRLHLFGIKTSIENKIGPTILRSSLMESSWLSKLTLENTCTDSILECVGLVARNLTYLNISNSNVTDQGLLHLVGVENDSSLSRKHLTRKCKQNILKPENLVKDKNPRWIKHKNRGTDKLVFLTAMDLDLKWPMKGEHYHKYYNSTHVPIDCGFIAILDFIPSLKGFNTEVGCRAVAGFARYQRWARKSATRDLNLETLTETKPTSTLLECVGSRCPKLKKLIIAHPDTSLHTEEWMKGVDNLKQLQHLIGSSIDLGTSWFSKAIPSYGYKLSTLHFDDVRVFKYSFIKLTKELCPNLTKLSLLMASKSISPYRRIKVEKDMDLRSLQQGFHNLLELHLVGPLFSEYVRYAVAGANQLKCLTLGVEWPDESYCNVGPESRKDVLGKEYIEELLSVNSLQYTEELHFFAQNRRGSVRLTESFAVYLATTFKNLKHLGSFQLWSREANVIACMQAVSMVNPIVSFDENYNVNSSRGRSTVDKPSFCAKTFKDSSPYSCAWLNIQQPTSTFLSEMAEFLVGPAIPWDFMGNQAEDQDLESDSEDSDSSSELGELLHPLHNFINPNDLDSDDEVGNEPLLLNNCPVQ